VNDIPITLEHIDLFNCLDWLHVHFLQCALELLVIRTRTLVNLLDLSPRGTLAAMIWLLAIMSAYENERGSVVMGLTLRLNVSKESVRYSGLLEYGSKQHTNADLSLHTCKFCLVHVCKTLTMLG
jgi:hypothetical protein